MLVRGRQFVALLVTGSMLYAGPVAACLCMAHDMPTMSCCPDMADAEHGHEHDSEAPASHPEASSLCDPMGGDVLSGSSFELPDPQFVLVEAVNLSVSSGADQTAPMPHMRPWAQGPPVYLATQRLRI